MMVHAKNYETVSTFVAEKTVASFFLDTVYIRDRGNHRRRSCEGPGVRPLAKNVLRGSTTFWTLVKYEEI